MNLIQYPLPPFIHCYSRLVCIPILLQKFWWRTLSLGRAFLRSSPCISWVGTEDNLKRPNSICSQIQWYLTFMWFKRAYNTALSVKAIDTWLFLKERSWRVDWHSGLQKWPLPMPALFHLQQSPCMYGCIMLTWSHMSIFVCVESIPWADWIYGNKWSLCWHDL